MSFAEYPLGEIPLGASEDESPFTPVIPSLPFAPFLYGEVINTTGSLIGFNFLASEVCIKMRGFSSSGAICYVQPNAIPSAAVGGGGIGLGESSSKSFQGKITGIGAIMTAGTGILELIAYIPLPFDSSKRIKRRRRLRFRL